MYCDNKVYCYIVLNDKYKNNASDHHYTIYTIRQGTMATGCMILITWVKEKRKNISILRLDKTQWPDWLMYGFARVQVEKSG